MKLSKFITYVAGLGMGFFIGATLLSSCCAHNVYGLFWGLGFFTVAVIIGITLYYE